MSATTAPDNPLLWAIACVVLSLALGSCIRIAALRNAPAEIRTKRLKSLRTWWILTGSVCLALLAGRLGMCVLFTFISILAIREYAPLVASRPASQCATWALYVIAIVNYFLLFSGLVRMWQIFTPLATLIVITTIQLMQGETKGYIKSTSGLAWGSITLTFALSHAALLFAMPQTALGPVGSAGWFLYLVLLTETNDIAQALTGRRFGAHKRHRIAPTISPNKTWEGFLGGLIVTVLLSVLMAPWLTTLTQMRLPLTDNISLSAWLTPIAFGCLITTLGFIGDINMSAIKRDAGVKDGSQLLAGMGGMIDRIDSLTFTAPAFAWLIVYMG